MSNSFAPTPARQRPDSSLPQGVGVGFKSTHFDAIFESRARLGFFEIHAENHLGAGGPSHEQLERLRADYALSIHGVALSLGGAEPPDEEHLARLKALNARYAPALFSEHLAWSTQGGAYFGDLLPIPYTTENLRRVADNVARAQEALGRRIAIENPATYVVFRESTWSETEFLAELVRRTDCALLLDVNNVYVSAINHGFPARDYVERFPMQALAEIHLAGFAEDEDEGGARLLIDAHCAAVADDVWALYDLALTRCGPVATLVEWDNDLPDWPTLHAEARRAKGRLDACGPMEPAA
jgi:uncharacterized protein (UPF0276 family)